MEKAIADLFANAKKLSLEHNAKYEEQQAASRETTSAVNAAREAWKQFFDALANELKEDRIAKEVFEEKQKQGAFSR